VKDAMHTNRSECERHAERDGDRGEGGGAERSNLCDSHDLDRERERERDREREREREK